mgnify:CR=1 FL=1
MGNGDILGNCQPQPRADCAFGIIATRKPQGQIRDFIGGEPRPLIVDLDLRPGAGGHPNVYGAFAWGILQGIVDQIANGVLQQYGIAHAEGWLVKHW